jgi:hypothetical protein
MFTHVLTVVNEETTGKVLVVQRRPDVLKRGLLCCKLSLFLLTKDVLRGR